MLWNLPLFMLWIQIEPSTPMKTNLLCIFDLLSTQLLHFSASGIFTVWLLIQNQKTCCKVDSTSLSCYLFFSLLQYSINIVICDIFIFAGKNCICSMSDHTQHFLFANLHAGVYKTTCTLGGHHNSKKKNNTHTHTHTRILESLHLWDSLQYTLTHWGTP